ncbi:hypothetical protein O4H49_03195 [Kiloniella laminariae]|uniref:Uncharacterized protein n=1 Tax=Kiloniella laminariae TaxID=454162 RepID=A0ABT4LF97_9PROT|nr:hypothetical protein [Kiloniella laminariae]MCZ4279769.1 hypothetical protein [Kiloniella laminariae]
MQQLWLELTFPYACGGRVAAEFDVRVAIGLEDDTLLAGEVELYGYDKAHIGAYQSCDDQPLCQKIRNYLLTTDREIRRAQELLARQSATKPASPFAAFIRPYQESFSPGFSLR